MKKILKSNWLFIGILLIQLIVLISSFAIFKQGYHSDELYEYGFANSYDLRVLEADDNGVGLDRQWTDSNELLKYISVERNHRFSYLNIFKHASMDYYNPPLKLFLLHTICSFFPGVFSRWFSFSINIVSFVLIQVFLYLLIKKMTNNIPVSIACISLFGFGAGCFNAMMFLRMYAMGMALGTIFLYFSHMYFTCEEKKKNFAYLIAVFFSLFAGAYTLHLFLVYAFPIVLIICISYLFLKKIKKMISYGFSCLGAVVLSFLAFPNTVSDTMQSTDSYSYSAAKYSNALQFRIYTSLATAENFGFHTSMYANPWIKISIAIFIFLVILAIPLFVLFRKEEWFKKFLKNLKNRIIIWAKDIGSNAVFLIACIVTVFFVIYISAIRTSVYTMTIKYTARYVYMIYPILCLFATLTFYYLLKFFISKKESIAVVTISIALILASLGQILNVQPYLMLHQEKGKSLDKIESDANCYLFLKSNWTILCFADELYDTNSYYFVNYNDYENEYHCFDYIDSDKPLYFILDCSYLITDEIRKEMEENPDSLYNTVYKDSLIDERDVLNHYKSIDIVKDLELVGEDNVFERPIKIYRVDMK